MHTILFQFLNALGGVLLTLSVYFFLLALGRSDQTGDDEAIIVGPQGMDEIKRLSRVSGCANPLEFMLSAIALSKWTCETLEKGYFIGRIDEDGKTFKILSTKEIFPNYSGPKEDSEEEDNEKKE